MGRLHLGTSLLLESIGIQFVFLVGELVQYLVVEARPTLGDINDSCEFIGSVGRVNDMSCLGI